MYRMKKIYNLEHITRVDLEENCDISVHFSSGEWIVVKCNTEGHQKSKLKEILGGIRGHEFAEYYETTKAFIRVPL